MLAQQEARRLNHNYIGTEHILLGLIHEGEGVAAKALQSLGVSLDAVRREVEEIIGQGGASPSAGHIPFTPRSKKVLELSLREALQLDLDYIGTEHILLGLVREGEGVAAQVLVKLGADLATVRQAVIDRFESGATDAPKPVTSEELGRLLDELAGNSGTVAGRALAAGGWATAVGIVLVPGTVVHEEVLGRARALAGLVGASASSPPSAVVLLAALALPACPVEDPDRIRREVFRLLADGATDPA